MNAMDIERKVWSLGVIPSVTVKDSGTAGKLAETLAAGGIPCAEVDFGANGAEGSLRKMAAARDGFLLGAGNVPDVSAAAAAVTAGAKFLSSPAYDRTIADWTAKHGVAYFPGARTVDEVRVAVSYGVGAVKFTSEGKGGSIESIDALRASFPQVRLVVSGVVRADDAAEYSALRNVLAVAGSWMAEPEAVGNGEWDMIASRCRDAVAAVHGFGFAHMGVNCDGRDDADGIAGLLSVFAMRPRETEISTFMNDDIELMHRGGRGARGHMGFRTRDVERALAYLSDFGFKAVPETAKFGQDGKMALVYLDREIGGFAVHLVRK